MSFPKVQELLNEKDYVHQQSLPWVTLEVDNSMTGSSTPLSSLCHGMQGQEGAGYGLGSQRNWFQTLGLPLSNEMGKF